MGDKPASELFNRVVAERATASSKPTRDFSDYEITLDGKEHKEFKTVVGV